MRASTPVEGEKISTSRALMNYSKVVKKTPSERFKVKRERSLVPGIGQVMTQRVTFQQK